MKSLIIVGAGKIGKRFYSEILVGGMNQKYKEIFYYDNDPYKQEMYINGVLVLSYAKFAGMIHEEECEIILATDYWKELLKFCKDIGCENKVIGIYSSISFKYNPYVRRIYGQDAEEVYLSEKIGEKYGYGYKCFYVDVGAHHPYRFSNTHWAYVMGGHGINIEPNADAIEQFNKMRCRDININCGIGIAENVMKYYKFEEPAFNTFEESEFKGIRTPKEVVDVPVKTLKLIFEKYEVDKIDFMNIDVEGLEMQVLQSNDWNKYKPFFILIEQKNMSVKELIESEIYLFLTALGYECEWKGIRTAIYRQV